MAPSPTETVVKVGTVVDLGVSFQRPSLSSMRRDVLLAPSVVSDRAMKCARLVACHEARRVRCILAVIDDH